MAETKRTKLLTPIFRVCFPAIAEKERQMDNSNTPPKYAVTMVFDQAYLKAHPDELARFKAMQAAAETTCVDKFKKPLKDAAVKLSNFRNPFRDGAEKEHLSGFGEGTIYVKASSKNRPGVVAADGKTILDLVADPDLVYPGCYARATLGVYAYDNRSKGVAFGLNNVMFIRDGERLDSRGKADEDFGEVAAVGAPDDDLI